MEVNPADLSLNLIETNVVEPLEAGARYCSYTVVGNQKVFLPSHEYVVVLGDIWEDDWAPRITLLKRSKCTEFTPVIHVCFEARTPVFMLSNKAVLRSDDFALKVCSESWVIFGYTCRPRERQFLSGQTRVRAGQGLPTLDAQIATQK